MSYLLCFLLGTQTRILFCLSIPPGSELSTASHSCTDVWKFERSYQEAIGSGLVTYAISWFLRRVNVAFVMEVHKNPPFSYKFYPARCRENTVPKHLFCLYCMEPNGELWALCWFSWKLQKLSRHCRGEEDFYIYWEQNLRLCSPWPIRYTSGAFPDFCHDTPRQRKWQIRHKIREKYKPQCYQNFSEDC